MSTNPKEASNGMHERLYIEEEIDSNEVTLDLDAEDKNEEAQVPSLTELEKVQAELDEVKKKYEEKIDECLIAEQKQETASLLEAAGLHSSLLDVVYTQKDMNATKEKIQIIKGYIKELKKKILDNEFLGVGAELPLTSANAMVTVDPFLEGFMSV